MKRTLLPVLIALGLSVTFAQDETISIGYVLWDS